MLCLHGFPECWYSWRYILDAFSETHRVIAVDLRGYGETAHANASWWHAADYSSPALVEDVRALIDAFGVEKVTLVAHDWGGMIAWAFAAAHPSRLEKLVILNAPHPLAFRKNMSMAQALRSAYIAVFQLPWLPEILVSAGGYRMLRNALTGKAMGVKRAGALAPSEGDVAVYKWVFSRAGTLTAALNYYRNVFLRNQEQLRQLNLKDMRTPTLLLWGEDDGALGPELTHGMDKFCSDIEVRRVPRASHWLQQDAVMETIHYLARFLKVNPSVLSTGMLAPDGSRVHLQIADLPDSEAASAASSTEPTSSSSKLRQRGQK